MKKTLKKALVWIDDHEEGIFAVMYMALFLANTYCAIRTYINPEWGTESVTSYAVKAFLELLISMLYLRIELDKAVIGLLKKIREKQHEIISQLLKDTPWKK